MRTTTVVPFLNVVYFVVSRTAMTRVGKVGPETLCEVFS